MDNKWMNIRPTIMLACCFFFCSPGWVQARRRHFRGGPEERSADPSCFSHSCHWLQQASKRTEAQNIRLESLSVACTVSQFELFSWGFNKLKLKITGKKINTKECCISYMYVSFSKFLCMFLVYGIAWRTHNISTDHLSTLLSRISWCRKRDGWMLTNYDELCLAPL